MLKLKQGYCLNYLIELWLWLVLVWNVISEQCTRYGSIKKPIAQGKTINSTFMLSDAV